MTTTDPDALPIQLLLECIFRKYGFDFRDYAYASIKRRIGNMLGPEGVANVTELQHKVLHDPACMERFLLALTVHVTAMFRDPTFYLALRTKVVPLLRTYPFVRVWHAGCSTGEEVYSLAILLHEEGLYPKCRIYATDLSEAVLDQAKAGIFRLGSMQEYTANFLKAGGKCSFSEYYTADNENAIFNRSLKTNIVFAQHNLVTDASFNEFNVILCRNVLIYFNAALAERVHGLFYDSLCMFGFLCLGSKESHRFTPHQACYEEVDAHERIYRRIT